LGIKGNHIHIYQEGHDDKFATLIDNVKGFENYHNKSFEDKITTFCKYCSIRNTLKFNQQILLV
jgi:hypothetical protein